MAKLNQNELQLRLIKDLGMLKTGNNKQTKRYGIFECPCCLKHFEVVVASIKNGNTKKCTACKHFSVRTHGGTNLKGYKIWEGMVYRCHNENSKDYKNYNSRGIEVQTSWRTDPVAFIEYIGTLEFAYENSRTIDRIDNNRGYEVGNLRWATKQTQSENSTLGIHGKSRFKGVTWNKEANKWMVRLMVLGKRKLIGYYTDELQAAKAYDNYVDTLEMPNKLKNRDIHGENYNEF